MFGNAWNPATEPTDPRERALRNVEIAARDHTAAIDAALAADQNDEGHDERIRKIFAAGSVLDQRLTVARNVGIPLTELAAVTGLHQHVIDELLAMNDNTFFL